MHWKSFADVPHDGVAQFIEYFGAVHFSNVFSPLWDQGFDDKLNAMKKAGGSKRDLGYYNGKKVYFDDFLHNFLMPLWMELRTKYARKKKELHNEIAAMVGATNPTPGLSRAAFTLFNHKVTSLPSRFSLKPAEGPSYDDEDDL